MAAGCSFSATMRQSTRGATMDTNLRPMTTGEILDRTFKLYRTNFALFAGIAMIPAGIGFVMHALGLMTGITVIDPSPGKPFGSIASASYEVLLTIVVYFGGGSLSTGAAAYAVSLVHLGKPATIRASYGKVLQAWGRVIGIVFVLLLIIAAIYAVTILILAVSFGLLIFATGSVGRPIVVIIATVLMMGILLLIWLYITARYSLAVPACVMEKTSVTGSLKRSSSLAKGSLFRIVMIYLLTVIINVAFAYALLTPILILISMNKGHMTLLTHVLTNITQFVAATLAGPIAAIALPLVYIDQRVRKEAFDLQIMMEAVQQVNTETMVNSSPLVR
jgi:glycerophosphoryl diester phosphodiesterase family protein